MNNFYVYKYIRSRASKSGLADSPYYIGKGRGIRAFSKTHSVHLPKDRSYIVIISQDMNEIDAFQAEILLIYLYGRIDNNTGCLRNLTDGGEGLTGRIISEEHKAKMSIAHLNPSKETRKRMSISMLGKNRRPMNAETRAKLSISHLGKKMPPETKALISSSTLGIKKGPMKEDTKAKLSIAKSGKKCSEDTKAKMSASHRLRLANKTEQLNQGD